MDEMLLRELALIFGFIIYLSLIYLLGKYAEKKGRSAVVWVFLSFLITPILTALIVWGLPANKIVKTEKTEKSKVPILIGIFAVLWLLRYFGVF